MQSPFSRWGTADQFVQAPEREAFFRWPKVEGGTIKDVVTVQCEQVCWQRPGDKQTLLIRVAMCCPRCAFPFIVTPNQEVTVNIADDGTMDIPAIVRCHGNWPEVKQGIQTGEKVRCGWAAVIRGGWAHNPQCPAAATGNRGTCQCGCNLSQEQLDQIRRS